MTTMHVSHNFACDRQIRELGEDYLELKLVARTMRLLQLRVSRARLRVDSPRAKETLFELDLLLQDARDDSSIAASESLAKDAAVEAMVGPVRVSP